MGQGGERPVFAASESQGGEWAFKRSRNSETGVFGELSEYSFEKVNIILIQMESKHLSKPYLSH